MVLLLSMALAANGASVATDSVQSVYDVAGSGLNGIGQRYDRISDGAEIFLCFACLFSFRCIVVQILLLFMLVDRCLIAFVHGSLNDSFMSYGPRNT